MLEFEAGEANRMRPADARFYAEQMQRWGQVTLPEDTAARLARIFAANALEKRHQRLASASMPVPTRRKAQLFDRLPR